MKRHLSLVLAGMVVGALLAGCGGEKPTPPPKPPVPPRPTAKADHGKILAAARKAAAFIAGQQNADGSYGEPPHFNSMVGMTGLAVLAMAESGTAPGGVKGRAVQRAVEFMLKHRQPDGGIYIKGKGYNSYETSVAIMALVSVDREKHKEAIAKARDYLINIQDKSGGIGYGSDKTQSNLSTTHYALQALKAAGVKEDEEVWKRAMAFVGACQNNSETNKLGYAAVVDDGGFIYTPKESKAGPVKDRKGRIGWRSYGSMTYAGYLCYVYAKLKPEDPRVKGAERWIKNNYTLDENPAMGKEGLYYYYHTFALALAARGKKTLKTVDGVEHDWARELGAKLLSLQGKDGGWKNEASRWHESSRVVCTSYALRALGKVLGGPKR